MSKRDSLTGLLNRMAFEEMIKPSLSSHSLCAMIILDLDNFKTLNDTLGHFERDRCLCSVANDLKNVFDNQGDICRLGGDEFAIFMPHISSIDDVQKATQTLLEKIPQRYESESEEILITYSIGVVCCMMDDVKQNESIYEILYKAADEAMYESKAEGKNSVTFFSGDLSKFACISSNG